jgi:hypothetical protein
MKTKSRDVVETCSMCGSAKNVVGCGVGLLCEACAESNRVGRDQATRKAKLAQKALTGKSEMAQANANGISLSDLDTYSIEAAALMALDDRQEGTLLGAGGEVVPQDDPDIRNTLATPGVAALDASRDRLALVAQVGIDRVAMAVDAADSIKAANSIEMMLAHQMAALHATAMDQMAKANLIQDPKYAIAAMNLAIRAMSAYQNAVLVIKRLRSSGSQQIVIKHIDARSGGMVAISGAQPTTGGKSPNAN